MKIVNFRRAVASALAAGGLLVGGARAVADTQIHNVGDPGFEQIALGTIHYYYFQGPPNSPFWKKGALSTGNNAVYDFDYATQVEPDLPDPHSGNQAVDGEGAYNYQILSDTFVAGRTYTYTAWTQGWANNTSDANDRFWMYFFAGTGASFDQPVASYDNNSLVRVTFHQDGTLNAGDPHGVGTGTKGVLPFTGFNRNDGSAWTQVGLTYTATAADAGKHIGLAFWANELGAVDDIGLTSTSPGGILGDYDGNGSVGPEDFTMWKNSLGQTASPNGSGADGNSNGIIDAADYTIWRDRSGAISGSGGLGSGTVPEPHTFTLGLIAAAGAGLAANKRKRK
jgi:dockerin type I repeat protein/PEP-CTERM motif-containing protein